jgi:hypothetical protein
MSTIAKYSEAVNKARKGSRPICSAKMVMLAYILNSEIIASSVIKKQELVFHGSIKISNGRVKS